MPPTISERLRRRQIDARRGSAHQRGYTWRWAIEAKRFLSRPENVLCVDCKKRGKLVPATEVDHIIPHRGNQKLFWDRTNWQGLCHDDHSSKTMRELNEQRTGKPCVERGCDAQGQPSDPKHPWNR